MEVGMTENGITNEDRRLLVEALSEMRELRGELSEFKKHVMARVERLEKKDGERTHTVFSALSLFISAAALVFSIAIDFVK
jgi:hypothetical protein